MLPYYLVAWGIFHYGNFNPSRADPGGREQNNFNFYFHASLQWLK